MPLPTERTVTGKYVNPVTGEPYDGTTGEHYVIFEPVPDRWTDRQGNQILLGGGRVNLGADGSFAEDVVCTDVPDVLPEEGRLWRLRQYVGGAWAVQYLAVPAAPDALDITDALSVDVCGVEYVPVPGPPGPPGEPTQVTAAPPMSATSGSPGTVTISVTPGAEGQVLTTSEGQAVWAAPSGGGSGGAIWGSIVGALDDQADLKAALDAKIPAASRGDVNGVAALDDTGKVPLAQLPAFPASQINSGTLDAARIPDLSSKYLTIDRRGAVFGVAPLSGSGVVTWNFIGSLPASQIASGIFDPARIPDLSDRYVDTALVGVADGVASLGPDGKIPADQVSVAGGLQYRGSWDASTNTPPLADGTGENGDLYKVSVVGSQDLGSGVTPFLAGDHVVYVAGSDRWERFVASEAVASVAGKTGVVTLARGDVGLGNVDNTADIDKPVSSATQTALDAKADASALADHVADTANPHNVTKAQVGLSSVDNTSDADKPVSSAQQAALDAKLNISGGSLTGPLSMSGHPVSDAGDPQQEQDLATKKYVDQAVAGAPSGASWGGITGTLDNQTDLKGALDSKLNTSGGAVSGSLAVGGHALGEATPASHRVLAWAYDPALAVNSTEITGGALYLVRVNFAADAEVTRLYWWVANQAGTPTAGQNHVGLYDSSGTLLASAAVESVLTSPGLKSATIAPQSVAAGAYCWVGLLFNATVPPSLTRASGWTGVGQAANLGLTPAEFRFAVNGTGRMQMPPSIDPTVNTAPDIAGPWVAVG